MSYDHNRLSTKSFIEKAIKKHGYNFDYSKCVYKHSGIPITIICKKCGLSFDQTPSCHLCGNKCPHCNKKAKTMSIQEFIKRAKDIHKDLYDYTEVVYVNSKTKVSIYCKKCKKYFQQQPRAHVANKQGCPKCQHSRGETKISSLLNFLNIEYFSQHTYPDCKSSRGYVLKFDFFIPSLNLCVEFDGEQHFDKTNRWHTTYTEENDKIKDQYCKDKNINLKRISYKEFEKIESIIKSILTT